MPDARTDDPGPDHAERVLTHPEALVDIALAALREKALNLDAENAVHGLDAHEELWFHPLLADGFAAAGLGVAREALYPGNVEALARLRARRAQRERCDLVLLPRAGARLLDPVARSIERDDIGTTLFAPVAEHLPPEPSGVAPADAYWMEVKVVGQFCFTDGWSGPNRAYAAELTGAIADVAKIGRDPHIRRGGLLLVLFTADQRTADHDIDVALTRASERGVRSRAPARARTPITDRIGNALCTLVLVPADCGMDDPASATPAQEA